MCCEQWKKLPLGTIYVRMFIFCAPPQHGHVDDDFQKDVKGKPDGALGRFVRNLSKYGNQPAKESAGGQEKESADGIYTCIIHCADGNCHCCLIEPYAEEYWHTGSMHYLVHGGLGIC